MRQAIVLVFTKFFCLSSTYHINYNLSKAIITPAYFKGKDISFFILLFLSRFIFKNFQLS